MADTFKFRIDHHGSLVRPPSLGADLGADLGAAVAEAVRMQRKLNLSVVTDGEFRRAETREAVFHAVSGFDGAVARAPLTPHRSLVADDVAALAALTEVPAKATLPAPSLLAAQCFDPAAGSPWRSARELGEALAAIIHDELSRIVALGVRYVQLTNPLYAAYLEGAPPPGLTLADAIAIDSLAVRLTGRPADVRIGLCPAHAVTGTVDKAAAEQLFASVPVDRWILPFATGATAEAELLRAVPADRDVCLGIVDPAAPALEPVDAILERMDVAAGLKDVADLAVSPSRGFADVAARPLTDADGQRATLIQVETIARMVWGNEL